MTLCGYGIMGYPFGRLIIRKERTEIIPMSTPPLQDVSPAFWKILQPLATPFLPVIRTLVDQWPEPEPLWQILRDDLHHQPEHWLVRINWWAACHHQPVFTRRDWDRLAQCIAQEGWSWSSVVPGLIWMALAYSESADPLKD
jgi:hypothetical protein